MITIIQGAMWSGKTTKLLERINQAERCLVMDCCNTRNNARDLNQMLKQQSKDSIYLFEYKQKKPYHEEEIFKHVIQLFKPTLFVIDEFHLCQVFGRYEVIDYINYLQLYCDIVVCGLKYDFFSNYQVFPIWKELDNFAEKKEIWLDSLKPCVVCGSSVGVIYTRKIGDMNERIGDNYENICRRCAEKYN